MPRDMAAGFCALLLMAVVGGCTSTALADVTVTIDAQTQHQTMLGWGKTTSHLRVPDRLRDLCVQRMVDDLGLTRLRLEPPSGNRSKHGPWEWVNDNGDPYDIEWSAFDTEELDFRAAHWVVPFKDRVEANGDPFDIYVSPSYFDGGSSGTVPAWLLHSPGEYAEWATAALLRLKESHGIVADYYCICNEAGNNNAFRPDVVGRMIATLGPRLEELGLPTKIQFPEGVNAEVSLRYIEALRDRTEIWPYIGAISYHLYGKNEVLTDIRDFARERGLPTAQTEFMNLTMDHLYNDLTLGGASYWEIYGLGGPDYRLVSTYSDSSAFRGGPQYWNFRQVTHYVRPGAVRVEATSDDASLRALAFVTDGKATVALINTTPPHADQTVSVEGLPAGEYGVSRSVGRRIYEELGVQRVGVNGTLIADVPANSVLTVYPRAAGNQPPTVTSWTSQPHFPSPPADAITLQATATDPELDPITYAWSVVGQPEGANVTLADAASARTRGTGLSAPGEYVLEIAVSDADHTIKREVMLTVFAENQPPVPADVHNRIPIMVTLPHSTTELRAGAWDVEGDEVTYQWSVVQQPVGSDVVLEAPAEQKCRLSNITVAGDYIIRLAATDPTHTVIEDLNVTVFPVNAAPTIEAASATPAALVLPGSKTTLSATTSDPDGDVISHWWHVKVKPAGATPAFAKQGLASTEVSGLTAPGTYVFTLTVVDLTKHATGEVVVTVSPEGAAAQAADQPGEPPPDRSTDDRVVIARGTLVGTVIQKGRAWVEVRSEAGNAERYIPEWRGGMPRDGGGPDAGIVAKIGRLNVGDRVSVRWYVNDHVRIDDIQPAP